MGLLSWLLVLFLPLQVPAPAAAKKPPAVIAPVVLQGLVKGPDGKPVAHALVVARRRMARADEAPMSTRTDATGAFRLPLKARDPLDVWVQADGLVLRKLEGPALDRALAVTLAAGAMLEGRVLDGTSGSPLPGARVMAQLTLTDLPSLPLEPEFGRARASTDAGGRFRLTGLVAGVQNLSATARGFGRARQEGVRPGTRVEFFLFPGASISGAVGGLDGKPLAGALVSASRFPLFSPRPEPTDALGRFEIPGLDPGTYDVTATAKGLAPGVLRDVLVRGTDDERVTLSLEPPVTVIGRVMSDASHPVTARVLVQELGGAATPRALAEAFRVDTDADGRFRIEGVPPGSQVLGVLPRGFAPRRVDLDVRSQRPLLDLGDVLVERGLTISGRVKTAAGQGVADAQIWSYTSSSRPRVRGTSAEDGTYVLAGVEPGVYQVGVSARGFADAIATFDAGARDADVTLEAAGTITGEVVDRASRAVETFTATARRLDTATESMQDQPVSQSFSVSDGRFLLEDVPAGEWVLLVQAPGHASATVSKLKVSPAATAAAGRIRLPDGGTLHGAVTDPLGAPVAGATIFAGVAEDYGYIVSTPPQTQSDVNGAWELRGLPLSKIDVSATHPNYASTSVSGIEVDPETPPAEVRLVLSRGGRVEGSVRRRDGTPVGSGLVSVTSQTTSGRFLNGDYEPTASVGPDGVFVVERIPAGRARLRLLLTEASSMMRTGLFREIEVVEGETTRLDLTLSDIAVTGTVTRASGSAAGLRVQVRSRNAGSSYSAGGDAVLAPASGPTRGYATTGEDGHYELIVGEPGSAFTAIESGDGRVRLSARTVEIPDSDSFVLDFDLRGSPVSGLTVQKDSDVPVPRAKLWSALIDEHAMGSGASASSDAAGRFQLDLEPGRYLLAGNAEGFAPASQDVTVGAGGLSDVRVEFARGQSITGRVVDVRGAGVGGLEVTSLEDDGGQAYAVTRPDGSFQIADLASVRADSTPLRYSLSAGSELRGFATVGGISPGDPSVTLQLRPAGRARLLLRDESGNPVAGATAVLAETNGVQVDRYLGPLSDAQGQTEVSVPFGVARLELRTKELRGSLSLEVGEEVATATVVLKKPE